MLPAWQNEWNNIIRYVIFQDETLKTLMKIPTGTSILTFLDKHFIETGIADETLSSEDVRIIYGDFHSEGLIPHFLKQQLSFDIYVKKSELRNATKDRLVLRTHLIANRLNALLTKKDDPNLGGFVFRVIGETSLGTSLIGYTRYNITFEYKRTT